MATLAQSTVPAIPVFSIKHSIPKVERGPPVHTDLKRRISILDDQDDNGLDRLSDVETRHNAQQHYRRSLLDSLAIDVGEKYLDEIYREDDADGTESYEADPTRPHAQSGKKNLAC
ncbi:uncharacterized protein PITG_14531 [Phytophthora infestans T30-4]|uniref:Uncharacterized protein n=1 Tax=Phytophthora infestans (strain T30-4) TaxID=403677 RepID=D0NQ25_PHYIT|nr:uncharacterized protein PITG_14531 [Phytophthora infestans T30-4]EEY62737.1 hypothetical protein PITG_14531 [Phytophthora infestans T30-4]|eukprot:XP_002898979.1 hypothetical protein PITG_14531 [Phytophthora infestans T30-4]